MECREFLRLAAVPPHAPSCQVQGCSSVGSDPSSERVSWNIFHEYPGNFLVCQRYSRLLWVPCRSIEHTDCLPRFPISISSLPIYKCYSVLRSYDQVEHNET